MGVDGMSHIKQYNAGYDYAMQVYITATLKRHEIEAQAHEVIDENYRAGMLAAMAGMDCADD